MEPSQTQETSVPTKFANFSLSSSLVRNTGLSLLPPLAILLVLYLSSFYSFLLFHSLVELGTILLSFAIFVFTWNTRQYLDNNYLLFIGISFLALLIIDTTNMLVYRGIDIFPQATANMTAQLEIVIRLVHALSFLLALYFLMRNINIYLVMAGYALCLILIFTSIFYWDNFPIVFIEGKGITDFKIWGEYISSLILVIAAIGLVANSSNFKQEVLVFLIIAILAIAVEGLVLTRTDYQPDNIIHHIVKIISFYLVYKAIIETGLQRPLSILMRNLKRSQEEQWQVSLKLAEQNEELEAFAHTVAHDLKNPISAILMAAVAASDPALDEREKKSFLADIKGTAVKMNSITDNLMMLARVRKSEIHLEALDMQEILNSVFVRLRPMIQEHQAEIHSQQDWPAAVGYAPWIEEVWANYLSNAIQYGGEPPCIQIGATTQPDGMLRFWIRDNGSGIPLEEQSKLFKPFSQIQTLKSIGHGLGLSIVRRIIERLDGQVGVESQPGQGSTFYFTLPEM
jgi:signal transduction histidine kinase